MMTTPFVGGPLDGMELTIRSATNEIYTFHDGLVLRYNRVGESFWLDAWSRPLTEGEQVQIEALLAERKSPPFIGQAMW